MTATITIIGELLVVMIITVAFMTIAFGIFCYKHSKKHKK